MTTHRQRRKERRKESNQEPPGRYVAWALLIVAVLSLVGGGGAFALLPAQTASVVLGSALVTTAVLGGLWATLQNVRQINDHLGD